MTGRTARGTGTRSGLRFGAVPAARIMLSFGGDVEVVSPSEVRADVAAVAARTVVRYAGAEPE
jgi:hypothetical protein